MLRPYALLIVIVPVLFLPEVLPLWLVCIALGLVPVYFILYLRARRESVATPFNLPILFLLLSVPLSLYASVDMRASLSKLAGILLGVCLFYALLTLRTQNGGPGLIVLLLLLGGWGMSLVALVATDWQSVKLPLLGSLTEHLPRLIASIPHPLKQGGGINPNEVGGVLALILPLNLVLAWESVGIARPRHLLPGSPSVQVSKTRAPIRQGTKRPVFFYLGGLVAWCQRWNFAFLIFSLAVGLFTLFLSESRSAVFGLAIGVCLLVAIRSRPLRLASPILLAVGAVLLYGIGIEQVGSRLFDSGASGAQAGSLNLPARLEIWQRAVFMLQDFPFTGIGLNTFPIVLGLLYPLFLTSPDVFIAHAHNMLLQVGVDLGVPGLVSYVALLTIFFGCAILAYRRTSNPTWRAAIAGLAAGMLAHQVYGLTDAIALGAKPGVLFWMFLALMAVLYERSNAVVGAGSSRPVAVAVVGPGASRPDPIG